MSCPPRGPTGAAPPPPAWLPTTTLPLVSFPAQSTFVRIHRSGNPPIFFSPGPRNPPIGRFDSATGTFGVLYLATTFEGAFVETVLRNPARRLVSLAEIATRSMAVLAISRPVRLAALHGPGLQTLGLDNAIATGPYHPCGLWADALYTHPDQPDGIAYASRYDPQQTCIALFSRPDLSLSRASDSIPLSKRLPEVSAILRGYGKGLDA